MKPVTFTWNGESMEPLARFRALCDKQYVVGETYPLIPHEERSMLSHNHFFASIAEAWKSLPEDVAANWASAEHLRKWALIRAGYRDERTLPCSSRAEARRIAAFVKPMDEFAVVIVRDAVVTIYTAKSQSVRAMGKADFQKSKDAVLEIVAGLVGVKPSELPRQEAA